MISQQTANFYPSRLETVLDDFVGPAPSEDRDVGTSEAAFMLGITPNTLHSWKNRGYITAVSEKYGWEGNTFSLRETGAIAHVRAKHPALGTLSQIELARYGCDPHSIEPTIGRGEAAKIMGLDYVSFGGWEELHSFPPRDERVGRKAARYVARYALAFAEVRRERPELETNVSAQIEAARLAVALEPRILPDSPDQTPSIAA